MSDTKRSAPITLSLLMSLGMILGFFASVFSVSLTKAEQLSQSKQPIVKVESIILPAGTQIPVRYEQGKKILLTKQESLSLTLRVATNITNMEGTVMIPDGSEIIGEIKPTEKGSRFFSQKLFIKSNNQIHSLDAISRVISKIETLIKGVNPEEILQEAILGDKASKLIASFERSSKNNRALSGLDPAQIEALSGWLLGNETLELVSINPNKDLNLTLQSDLVFK